MGDFVQYVHHNREKPVWVRKDLKGKHREHCLCFQCAYFFPDTDHNCHIAAQLFGLCVKEELVAPVWECPCFESGQLPPQEPESCEC